MASLAHLIRLPNQSGTLLLMLPTLWALIVAARGRPPVMLLFVFVAGSFLMRSAGVIMNDLADRAIDRRVERTRMRPLAQGTVTPRQAFVLLGILLAFAAALLLLLNPLTMALSPVAALLAALYPFAKRLIPLPQAVLGLAFGWGVIMAWTAVTQQLDPPAWWLYGAAIAWAIGYDTIYALQDYEDDRRLGVKSAAVWFGSQTWKAVGAALLAMIALLAIAGWSVGVRWVFYGILTIVAVVLIRQVLELRDPVDQARAFALFKQHVTIGWVILGAFWLGSL